MNDGAIYRGFSDKIRTNDENLLVGWDIWINGCWWCPKFPCRLLIKQVKDKAVTEFQSSLSRTLCIDEGLNAIYHCGIKTAVAVDFVCQSLISLLESELSYLANVQIKCYDIDIEHAIS